MADELKNNLLFKGTVEEPILDPLNPLPIQPIITPTDDVKIDPLEQEAIKDFLPEKGGELVNYDYIDVANGLGYTTFYPFVSSSGAVASYHLSNLSNIMGNVQQVTNGVFNFDTTTFNLPRILKGDAYVDLYLRSNAGSWTGSGAIILVRGATTTELGTFAPQTFSSVATMPRTCRVPITQTSIKRGDIIRVQFTVNGGDNYVYLDPTGVWTLASTTKVCLPFKLDI